jgi:8-amino-7-oxononanoate synthase
MQSYNQCISNIPELKTLQALQVRKSSALNRSRTVVEAIQGTSIVIGKKKYLSFASNDYLGLAQHPDVIKAYQEAINLYGVGSVSSPLLSGYTNAHRLLEEELAEFSGFPRTILFSSGYMANLALMNSLVNRNDHVFSDRHNHASLMDGIRLCKATMFRYPHLCLESLSKKLALNSTLTRISDLKNNAQYNSQWIITEGVYSMDGDITPLPKLIEIAASYGCHIILDDAHGFGVLGKEGRGTISYYGLPANSVSCVTGSFSKAFGCFGAFVGASNDMIEALVQFARPYIYSTAIPAALVASLRVSLKLLMHDEWRREKLAKLITQFKKGIIELGIQHLSLSSETPIQIITIGNSERAISASQFFKTKGIIVAALRPPTVALGQDRLRITLSALHTEDDIAYLLSVLEEAKTKNFV